MTEERQTPTFGQELSALINSYSLENRSDTPDFILAAFLENVLEDWNRATRARTEWFKPTENKEELIDDLGLFIYVNCFESFDNQIHQALAEKTARKLIEAGWRKKDDTS